VRVQSHAGITPVEVEVLGRYIYGLCGILVDQSKTYLLESRLRPLLEEFQCHSYGELCERAQRDVSWSMPRRINEDSPQQATGYQKENRLLMRNHGFSNSSL
jgi:hypothetical protein